MKETGHHRIFERDSFYLACLKSVGRVVDLYEVDSNTGQFTARYSGRL